MPSSFGRRAAGARLERMRASPRYDGGVFRNTAGVLPALEKGSGLGVAREMLLGRARRVPPGPLPSIDPRPAWHRAPDTGLRATWLGHSTVLIELDGATLLTDPVWSERASPSQLAGPRRFQPVPVAVEALPRLDAVIVSHDHYDHLDHATIVELVARGVPFVTSLGVGAHLEAWGVPAERIVELDWWEAAPVPGTDVVVTAAPSQHFSGRGLRRNTTLWSSMAITGPRHRVFFSGDTGLTPEFAEVGARLGPFDLVMLEVGAFHPSWGKVHLGPDNALEALALLGGGRFLPVHWGTFNLGFHAWDQPAERLLELAAPRGVELVMPRLGEAVEPARADAVRPWWRAAAEVPEAEARPDEPPATVAGEPID